MPKPKPHSFQSIWRTLYRIIPRVFFAVYGLVFAVVFPFAFTPVFFYTRAYTCVRSLRVSARGRSLLAAGFVILALTTAMLTSLYQPQPTAAAVSSHLNFQARLEMRNGAIANDGNYNVEFKIYNASTGGTALWTETRLNSAGQGVRVVNGYLTVNLGSVNAFPSSMAWDQELYITMNIGGTGGTASWDGEMNPRLKLTAVPYAFQAKNATQLQTANGTNVATLSFAAPTANRTVVLRDESGTVCLELSNNCGFALASGSSSYIQNNTSLQSNANFNIQTTSTTAITGLIRALTGQTADMFRFADASNNALSGINSSGQFYYQSGSFTGTLVQSTLAQSTAYNLPDPGTASVDICLSTGNCAGAGSGVTSPGGTVNYVPKFDAARNIIDSSIFDNGSFVGVNTTTNNGRLSVLSSSATQSGLFIQAASSATSAAVVVRGGATPGVGGDLIQFQDVSNAILAGFNASGQLYFTAGSNQGVISQSSLAQTTTYRLIDPAQASVDICLSTGNCSGAGTSVTSDGGTVNYLAKFNAARKIADSQIFDNGSFVGVNTQVNNGLLSLVGGSATQSTLFAQGSASATVPVAILRSGATPGSGADLLQLQDSTGSVVAKIDSIGNITGSQATFSGNTSITGTSTLTVGTGATSLGGTLTVAGLGTFSGGLTVAGATNINTTGTDSTAIGNATGTFSLASSGLNVNTAGALSGITGYIQGNGNFAISGTGTFSTGTGAVSLNGSTTVSSTLAVRGAGGLTLGLANTTAGRLTFANIGTNNLSVIESTAPTGSGNATFMLPAVDGGTTVQLCVSTGNCAGAGNSVTSNAGGTTNYVAKFTNTRDIGDSSIYDDGSFVGINTAVNSGRLSVQGSNAAQPAFFAQAASSATTPAAVIRGGALPGAGADLIQFQNSAGSVLARIDASGNLTAGNVTVNGNFLQSGSGTFGTGSGAVSLNGATSVTGSNTFTVGTGATSLGGTLGVTGATTLGGNVSITGASTLSVGTGATSLGGTLAVTGAATLSSTLSVTGASTFNGNVTVGNSANFTQTGTGTFSTGTGAVTLNGATTTINGNTEITGTNTFTVGTGAVTLGSLGAGIVTSNASGLLTSGNVSRNSSYFTGALTVPNGGTGASTFTSNAILFGNGIGAIQATNTLANATLITDGSGVPSLSQTLPAVVQGNITSVGTLTSGSIASGFGAISTGNNITTTATVQGATLNATSVIQLNGTDINTAGTLTNVAYLNQANTFTSTNTFNGNVTVGNDANFTQSGIGTFSTGTGAVSLNGNTSITGANTLTVGTGATSLGGTLGVSGATTISSTLGVTGMSTLSGGLTVTGATSINTTGTASTAIGNTTGTFALQSSGLNVTTAGALSGITTITMSGAITAATTGNTINGLIINGGALSGITGYNQASGNFVQSGIGSFSTGTGAVSLNGATSVTGTNTFTVGTGATSLGGTLGVTGLSTLNGGLTVTGATNINTTGTAATTIGNSAATFSLASSALNITAAGALSGITGYAQDSGNFAIAGTGTFSTGTGAISLNGNTSVTGSRTFTVGTGATALGGTLGVAGLSTLSGGLSVSGGATIAGGATISGATNINTTGTANTAIGNATGTFSLASPALNITAAGALSGITGYVQASGDFAIGGSGTFSTGTGDISLNGNTAVTGTSTFMVGTGATALGGTLGVTGLTTLSGGLTATGATAINTTGTANTAIGNATGTFTVQSSGLDVTAAGALSGITTITMSGAITAATTGNTINGLVINGGALSSVTGYSQSSGNFLQSGTGTFGTGTGAVSLNGATSVTGANTFTVGTGATSLGGTLAVTGTSTLTGLLTANGGITTTGNFSQTGATTFSTGTGAVSLNGATTVSSTLDVEGAGGVTIGVAGATAGQLTLANATNTNMTLLVAAAPSGAGNVTFSLPSIAGGGSDTICVQTNNNCNFETRDGTTFIRNQTTQQTGANFNIQARAATIAAVIQGATGQDIINFVNSAGSTVARIDGSGNLTAVAGNFSGNISQTGATTFSTGTGAVSLNGNTSVNGTSTFTVGTGATSLGGTLGVTGLSTFNGGLTVTGATNINTSGTANTAIGNTTGTFSLQSNALNITAAGAISGVTGYAQASGNFAQSGTGTFDTGTGAVSLNGATSVTGANTFTVGTGATSLGGTLAVTGTSTLTGLLTANGGITTSGNFSQTGATTFSTGTGTVSLNGATSVTGSNTFTVGTGATSLGGTLGVTGLTTLSGGLNVSSGATIAGGATITGVTNINTSSTDDTSIGNATGAFSLQSSALNVTAAGALSGITTITMSGAITAATTGNTINGLVINGGALSSVTGYSQSSGNFVQSGTGTFSTASGNVSLNGNTSVTGSRTFTVGTGATSLGGTLSVTGATTLSSSLTVTGTTAFQRGTDFGVIGVSNDVNFGAGSLIRLTGASAQTVTGIAGGVDGRILTIVNAGTTTATIADSSVSSVAANRIVTGTGSDIMLPAGAAITLVYDSGASVWRITSAAAAVGGVGVNSVGTLDAQTKSANGAVISGTSIYLQTADASNPGLVSTGTQSFAGAKTFTGSLTVQGSGSFTAAGTGLSVTNNATVGGTLGVTGATTLGGGLSVTGASSFSGNVSITGTSTLTVGTGATSLGGTLAVTGATTLSSTLTVTGASTFNGNVSVSGANTFTTGTGTVALGSLGAGLVQSSSAGVLSSGAADRNSSTFFTNSLDVANGGTGATSFTSNGILYGGGSGAIQATASAINSVLITSGTGVPSLSQTLPTAVQGNITRTGALASGSITTGFGVISTGNNITTTAAMQGATVTATGALQGATLSVGGGTFTVDSAGAITAATGIATTGSITQSGIGTFSTGTGAVTLNGNTSVSGTNTFTVGTGATSLGGTLSVAGASTFNGNVGITGTNTLTVGTGATSLGGTLGVTGATTLSSTLTVTGASTFNGNVSISGANTLTVGTGATSLGGTLSVAGASTFNGNVGITGTNTFTTGTGTVTLGSLGAGLVQSSSTGVLSSGAVDRNSSTFFNSTLTTANGGTGATSFTANGIIYGNGAGALQATAAAADSVLITSGTNVPSLSQTLPTAVQGNITGTGALASGSITTGFGTISTGNNITTTATIQGATVIATGALQGNSLSINSGAFAVDSTGAITAATGITTTGNVTQTGTGTFSTGTGAVSLNGNTSVSGSNTFTVGTGAATLGGTLAVSGATTLSNNLTVVGTAAFQKGSDYGVVGVSNDVDFGSSSLIRLTGVTAQTVTGIANGVDGRILTIVNASSATATIANSSVSSAAANRIVTGTGGDVQLPAGAAITLVYDSGSSVWRITSAAAAVGGVGVNSIGAIDTQTKSANGAVINNNALYLQTADATNVGLVSIAAQTFAGDKTFTGLITGSAGLTAGGGAVALTGNAASSFTTTSGALTLTSAAAAIWSTAAGNLTLQAGSGTISLGTSTNLVADGALTVMSGGANSLTVDAGGAAALNLGVNNTNAVSIARTGITTTVNGALTVTQAGTFNGGLTVGNNSNFTQSGTGTFSTGTGNVSLNGATTINGSTNISGAHTLTVGTGATSLGGTLTVAGTSTLNGNTSVSGSNTFTVGTGATSLGGTLGVTGAATLGSTLGVTGLGTFNGGLTVATGSTFTNASSTLLSAIAIADHPTGGNIGTAATTVDVATTFNLTQTTAGQTLTLPAPTDTAAGRIVYINSLAGNAAFTMYGTTINPGTSAGFIWNGSAWVNPALSASGVTTVGAIDTQTKTANGAVINGTTIYLQTADASNVGLVSTAAQTFAGAKSFNGLISGSSGLTISGGAVSLAGNTASSLTTSSGALTLTSAAAATWSTAAGDLTIQAGSGTVSLGTSTALTATGALAITSGGAGALTLDTSGAATLSLGGTNANGVSISRTGVATTINGSLTVTQAGTFNGGLTVANNSNFTQTGTGTFSTGSGNVSLNGATTVSSTLDVQGSGGVTIGVAGTTNGLLTFANSTNAQLSLLQALAPTGTGNVTYNLPSVSGGQTVNICLSTGNCAGAGGAITGTGTTNYIARFNSNSTINSSSILYDDGAFVGLGTTANNGLLSIISGSATQSPFFAQAAASATTPVAVIKGGLTPGAGGDLLQFQNSAGTVVAKVDASGNLTAANGTLTGNFLQTGTGTFGTGTGAVSLNGATAVTGSNTFDVGTGATSLGGTLTVAGLTTFNGNVSVSGANTLTVGTGATSLGGTLGVTGAVTLSGTLGVTGASTFTGLVTANGGVTIANNSNFSQTGIGTFSTGTGAVSLNGETTVTGTNDFNVGTGDTALGGSLTVAGLTTFNGNVSVSGTNTLTVGTGATSLGGTLGVTGATTLNSTLGVTGASTFTGLATFNSGVTVANNSNFLQTGTGTFGTGTGAVSLNGATTVSTTLNVQGAGGVTIGVAGTTDGALKLASGTSSNLTVIKSLAPTGTGDATINFPSVNSGATDEVCLKITGNCVGTGGGVTTQGGNQNFITKFTNSGGTQIGNSLLFDNGSFVGLNTTTNSGMLSIQGASALQAAFYVQAAASATTPVAVIKGGATPGIGGDLLQLQDSAGVVLAKFDASGNLTAVGGTFSGNISQTGATTFSTGTGAVSLNGATTINGNTGISGTSTFTVGTGATSLGGSLTVTGASTFNGNVSISGANTLTVGTGATSLGGTLTVAGAATFNGNVSVSGTNTFTTGTGAVTLGSLGEGLVQSDAAGLLSSGAVDRNSGTFFSNALSVANGGTGASTFTANGILYGSGTSAIQATAAAANSILATNGSSVPGLTQTLPTAVQGNITGTGALASGSITTGFGTISTGNNITTTATIQGATVIATGALQGNSLSINSGAFAVDSTGAITAATGITTTGNVTQTGTGTFSTGTGAVSLNGATTINGNTSISGANTLTVGTGASTFGGAVAIQSASGLTLGLSGPTGVNGLLQFANAANSNLARLQFATPTGIGNATYTMPAIAAGTADEICLKILSNCGGGNLSASGGQANYVARFTDATTLGTGLLYDNGSFVGVNTTANGGTLSILSSGAAQAAVFAQGAASATAPVAIIKGGATPGIGGDLLQLQNSAGTVLAKFDASGNLTAVGGTFSGNIAQTGSGTFSTGTGQVDLNGNTGVTGTNTFTTGTGAVTLGSLGTGIVTSNSSGLLSSGTISRNDATYFTNALSVANGGTGTTSLTSNGILFGNGTGAVQATAAAANSILITSGTNVPSLSQTLPTIVQGNITSTGALASGSITSGFGTISTGNNITTTATVQGATVTATGALQGNTLSINSGVFAVSSTGAITAATGIAMTGNFAQTGAGTFSTGTGAVSFNGPTSITGTNTLTVGTGATSLGGTLAVTGTSTFTGLGTFNGGLTVANNSNFSQTGTGTFSTGTGNVSLNGATTVSSTLAVQGSGGLTIGVAGSTAGSLVLANATNTNTVSIQSAAQTVGSSSVTVPDTAGVNDTFCLLTLSNCGSSLNVTGAQANYVARFTGPSSLSTGLLYDDNSFVGVNTTANSGTLSILSSGAAQPAFFAQAAASATTPAAIIKGGATPAAGGDLLSFQNSLGTTLAKVDANGIILASSFDATTSSILNIGTTNATSIALKKATTVNGNFTINTNGNFTQSGTGSFSTGTGQVDLNGNTNVTGANTLTVGTGATTLGGTLAVTGTSTFTGLATFNGGVTVANNSNFTQTGSGTFTTGTGNVSLQGATTVSSSLSVTGGTFSAGSSSQFQVNTSGNVTTSGSIQGASFDANAAGALSIGSTNATSIGLQQNTTVTGTFGFSALGTADTTTVMCRNSSNELATCNSTPVFESSTVFIRNQTTQQTSANFNILARTSTVAAVIQGASGQDIAQFKSNAGTTVAKIDASGNLTAVGGTFSGMINANGGLTAGANQNIAMTDGTGTFSQSYTNGTGSANSVTANNNAAAGTTTLNAYNVALSGAANATGSNTTNGINFGNVAAATNNTFNAIRIGTGYTDILNYNGTSVINGSGQLNLAQVTGTLGVANGGTGATTFTDKGLLFGAGTGAVQATNSLANAVLITDGSSNPSLSQTLPPAVQGNITSVGALTSGSIASGFGTINIASNITTSATVQGAIVNAATGFRVNGAATAGHYLRGDGTNFVSSALNASDISGTLFTLAATSGTSAAVTQGNTVTIDRGTSNNLTSTISGTTITVDIISNPTFTGKVTSSAGTAGLELSGAPAAVATSSLMQLGGAIASGNVSANGGTYIGINQPAAGAGSAADFLNFQNNGAVRLKVTTSGLVDSAAGFAVNGTSGSSLTCSAGNAVTGSTFSGGILTGGSCTNVTDTLQTAYNNSGTNNPQILLSSTNGGLKIQDGATAVTGNLLQISNNGGSTTYFGVSATATTVVGALNVTGAYTQTGSGANTFTGDTVFSSATGSAVRVTNGTFNVGTSDQFKVTSTGIVSTSSLGTADTAAYLCRNSSNQIASCNTTGAGAAFTQGGNDFGADAELGTNGAGQNLMLKTAGTGRLQLDASGNLYFQQNSSIDTASGVASGVVGVGTSFARTINVGNSNAATVANFVAGAYGMRVNNSGVNVTSASSAGEDLTFGDSTNVVGRTIKVVQAASGAGANLTIQAGSAGAGAVNGGNLVLQGGARGTTGGNAGAVVVKANGTDGVAFQVQRNDATVLFSANTSTSLVSVGSGSANITSSGLGDLYVSGSTGISGLVLIGTTTDGGLFDGTTHELTFTGTARHARTVVMQPEYAGATMTGDGTGNVGTMTSDFCSGSSRLNIPASGNPCAASEEHNYYSWTTATANNNYDVWVRYHVPSDFSAFASTNPIQMYGWATNTATDSVTLSMYSGGTLCGTATAVSTASGAWTLTNLGGYTNPSFANCSGITAGSIVTFRVKMNVGTAGNHARAGAIYFNYLSKY